MIAAIHQPNFFPWYGYFAKLIQSDIFIFQDDVPMPLGKSYVYRTSIRSQKQTPLFIRAARINTKRGELICEATIDESSLWREKLIKTLMHSYKNSKWFDLLYEPVASLIRYETNSLADYNIHATEGILHILTGVSTILKRSSTFGYHHLKAIESIPLILKSVGATAYLSGTGKGSKAVLHIEELQQSGIEVNYVNTGQILYQEPTFPCITGLSILDMLFIKGPGQTRQLIARN